MNRRLTASWLAASALFCLPASAQTAPPATVKPANVKPATGELKAAKPLRFRLYAGGAFFPTATSYDQTRTYPEFAEDAVVEGSFSRKKGAGGEVSLGLDVTPTLGVAVGAHFTNRRSDVDLSARFPHPFFFNRPRVAERTDTVDFSETAVHLDLVYDAPTRGLLGFSLFAGPSWFKAKTKLIDTVAKTSAYPFDEATITGINPVEVDKSAFGFNVGAGVDLRFSRNAGFGIRARFSQATISSGDSDVDTKAGGLAVGGGLALRF